MNRRTFIRALSANGALAALPIPTGNPAAVSGREGRPNILWIVVEDICPFLSGYGYPNPTPHLDRLAAGGVRFDRAFMPVPVCSPCRSALITGMMPTTLGTHNHHSSRSPETAIHLPPAVRTLPELFREAGYFTFNQGKDDYNFDYDREDLYTGEYTTHPLYGKSGRRETGWKDREPGQPFFGQIQLSGGKHIYRDTFAPSVKNPIDRGGMEPPPYYPDIPEVREDWAAHLDCIRITDDEVGGILRRLEGDGLRKNTVVFFFSDHGMRLWRHKQFCYDGGLRVPFIVSWSGRPERLGGAGRVREDLVSGLDISATSLALAGLPVPKYMESRDLFARDFRPREFVISTRDRCDYTIDRIRSVRTERFRYIRNFFPDRPYMQPNYRDEWDITRRTRDLHDRGELDPLPDRFWSRERPSEELYDLENDPHEIRNLAYSPEYREVLARHRDILTRWICRTGDKGQYPEDPAGLRYMLDTWRSRGIEPVNPEYDHLGKQGTGRSGNQRTGRSR